MQVFQLQVKSLNKYKSTLTSAIFRPDWAAVFFSDLYLSESYWLFKDSLVNQHGLYLPASVLPRVHADCFFSWQSHHFVCLEWIICNVIVADFNQ